MNNHFGTPTFQNLSPQEPLWYLALFYKNNLPTDFGLAAAVAPPAGILRITKTDR
jgi:hypothetical protein